MQQKIDAVLFVEKGEPDEIGKAIPLSAGTVLIGRPFEAHQPDIPLKSPFISKKHAQITYDEGHFIMTDMATNRHGSALNGITMIKGMPYVLKHNDEISLAKNSVKLRLCFESDLGKTLDFSSGNIPNGQLPVNKPDIFIDEERIEVLIQGKQMRPRLGKQAFELLALLLNNRNRAVSKDKIRDWVWKDIEDPNAVTDEAIHALVFRLKKSLKEYAKHIVAVHGCYRFDDEVEE